MVHLVGLSSLFVVFTLWSAVAFGQWLKELAVFADERNNVEGF